MSPEEELLQLLRDLPGRTFESEFQFTGEVLPALVKQLGYAESETFYQYPAGRWRADVVLSSSFGSTPWVVIELKRSMPTNVGDWVYVLKRYLSALNCEVGVVISPEILILIVGGEARRFDLSLISIEDVREIRAALERSAKPSFPPNPDSHPGKLVELIEAVERAVNTDEKGKSLEALARFLFDSVSSLSPKYSNLQTRSSEIDIIVEYDRRNGEIGLFEELGRYCLVECKNWSKPVGVGPVRDFMGKLDKCKTQLGIIFSKNGVTGVDSGADALREIQSRFDRDGVYLLIFSLGDLKGVKGGAAFVEAIDRKADGLRFDAQGC